MRIASIGQEVMYIGSTEQEVMDIGSILLISSQKKRYLHIILAMITVDDIVLLSKFICIKPRENLIRLPAETTVCVFGGGGGGG